jgi:hypothetical protein
MASSTMRSILLADALIELHRVEAKYKSLQELVGVWEAAEKVRSRSKTRRKKAA